MHFVSRNSRFYTFCVQLASWQQYMLTIVTLISILLFWHYVIYTPLEDLIASYQHRSTHARQTYTMAQAVQTKLADQKKQLHRLQGQLNRTLRPENKQTESISSVSMLAMYAQQAGLVLRTCSCEGDQNKEWYTEASLLFDATGSIDQLITFFKLLVHSTRVYGCSSLDITRLEDKPLFQARCLFSECLAMG